MFEGTNFICGTYVLVRYFPYTAHMHNLMGIFVSGTYLVMSFETFAAVNCVLECMWKNVSSMYPFSMLVL